MTLGFVTAGCDSVGGIESDEEAARTFAWNLHPDAQESHSRTRDANVDQEGIADSLGFERPRGAVDILVGGPPCPTFSRIGRAKLNCPSKSAVRQPDPFLSDPWNYLYQRLLDHVEVVRPLAVVMENVPEFIH